jgi:pectin methylesterase-like acyl-CoA thioesterase
VILVGDSTMATRTGYGDALCKRFAANVQCLNFARGGRSTKSYRADGTWNERVVPALARGDNGSTYVLIQFGHNDQPGKAERTTDLATEYPANLAAYVDEVKRAGAHPVLVTPLTRRTFRNGELVQELVPWADAMRKVGRAKGVPVLELNDESTVAVARMGPAEADTLAMESPKDFDRTHLGPRGAALFSGMVAKELVEAIPELAPVTTVPPQVVRRPQLTDAQAAAYTYREVLAYAGTARAPDPWDPLSDAFAELKADYVVEPPATVKAAIEAALEKVGGRRSEVGGDKRVVILLKPGVYREVVTVPRSSVAITLVGGGATPGDVRITASLDATVVRDGKPIGTPGSATVTIANDGFQARNLTFENGYNKDRGDAAHRSQAVAVLVDDADRVHFDNVRFIGYQDTLYLRSTSPERAARVFVNRSYVEGDMDFIFGESTAYFLRSEIRTLGDRPVSYTLAPSTHVASRYGFVFDDCDFTHDGTPNALAGTFRMGRQWFRGGSLEAVGKVAILNSRIGAHIDRVRPWSDWGPRGAPLHRPVQYDSADYYANRGLPGKVPVEPFLAEYRNIDK